MLNYIIRAVLFLFFLILIGNYAFNYKQEGLSQVYSVVCKNVSPAGSSSVQETNTDKVLNQSVNDYVSTAVPLLNQYLSQLNEILNKFNNIPVALSIGSIDVSSPQTQPIVIITPPIDNKIEQKLNFIVPKGEKGTDGVKPISKYVGPKGNAGPIGPKGDDGIYAIIEQQK